VGDSEIDVAEERTEQYSGDEFPVLGPNRKSHFEIIAEPADGASNRKSSNKVAPRSSNCYILHGLTCPPGPSDHIYFF